MVRPMENKSSEFHRSCGSLGTYGLLTLAAVLLAGCGIGSERVSPLEMKVRALEREKAQLTGQLEQSRIETEQVKAQVKALAVLPQDKKENQFYALSEVKITRFTDFYDKNGDGQAGEADRLRPAGRSGRRRDQDRRSGERPALESERSERPGPARPVAGLARSVVQAVVQHPHLDRLSPDVRRPRDARDARPAVDGQDDLHGLPHRPGLHRPVRHPAESRSLKLYFKDCAFEIVSSLRSSQ